MESSPGGWWGRCLPPLGTSSVLWAHPRAAGARHSGPPRLWGSARGSHWLPSHCALMGGSSLSPPQPWSPTGNIPLTCLGCCRILGSSFSQRRWVKMNNRSGREEAIVASSQSIRDSSFPISAHSRRGRCLKGTETLVPACCRYPKITREVSRVPPTHHSSYCVPTCAALLLTSPL